MSKDAEPTAEPRNASELALIYAAERLFAQHGIAGVSLRQINQAANQKNISAAHYHFGSREGLIEAVLEHRILDLDLRRARYLERTFERKDLHFYVEALVATLADELAPRPEGNHYLQFMQQYERYKAAQSYARSVSPAGVDIYDNIETCISYLPVAVRKQRMRYLVSIVHGVLAAAEREVNGGTLGPADIPLIVSDLADMVTAALAAPLSLQTLSLLEKARSTDDG